jgi:alpha-L-arabinofuranosidase
MVKTLRLRHPARVFLPRGFFPWRVSFICPSFLLLFILTALLPFGTVSRAFADVTITVNADRTQGVINPLVFGQNVLFDCNTMWDHRTDTLRSDEDDSHVNVKSKIEDLAPTILRFPGGKGSDLHIWEDGLGIQTTSQLETYSQVIFLDESPQSWSIGTKGLLIDPAPIAPFTENLMGQLGDRFDYTGVDAGNRKLTGITEISAAHSPGARVRPGGRPIYPDQNEISENNNWTNTYGIIEHLQLANSLGAQALLTVNYGTGLDSAGSVSTIVSLNQRIMRAQALVAFCNGNTSDTRPLGIDGVNIDGEGRNWGTVGYWAGKRVDAQGNPRPPFGVKYWEVGNELCFQSEHGYTTALDYAEKFKIFAQKMKEVDPQISVGAVGLNLPTWHGDFPGDSDPWNETVVKHTINDLDFLVIHSYYPTIQSPVDYTSNSWFKLVMAGAIQAGKHLTEIRGIIDANSPGREIGLAVTEYGLLIPGAEAMYFSNLARALHDADLLMYLIKKEGSATKLGLLTATAWDLHSMNMNAAIGYQWPDAWLDSGSRKIRPQYYALKMLRNNLASRKLVQTEVLSSPTFSINAKVGNIDPNPSVPCLEALGALSTGGRHLILAVINRSLDSFPNSTINANIQLNNLPFTPKSATVTKLKSTNLSDHNEVTELVKPTMPVTYMPVPQSFTFEPHSLTIIEFRPVSVSSATNLLLLMGSDN